MKKLLIVIPILFAFTVYASDCKTEIWHKNYEKGFIAIVCAHEAEQGHFCAQYNLALIYDQGDGVEQNKLLANEYFKQSCEQGFEKACNKLKK